LQKRWETTESASFYGKEEARSLLADTTKGGLASDPREPEEERTRGEGVRTHEKKRKRKQGKKIRSLSSVRGRGKKKKRVSRSATGNTTVQVTGG